MRFTMSYNLTKDLPLILPSDKQKSFSIENKNSNNNNSKQKINNARASC